MVLSQVDALTVRVGYPDCADPCDPDPCHGHGDCVNGLSCNCHAGHSGFWCNKCAPGHAGYPGCSSVLAEVALAGEIENLLAGSPARTAFVADFCIAVAMSLGLDNNSVTVLDIRAGSVIVTFEVLTADAASASTNLSSLAVLMSPGTNTTLGGLAVEGLIAPDPSTTCDASSFRATQRCGEALPVYESCRRSVVEKYLASWNGCYTDNGCEERWVPTCSAKVIELSLACDEPLLERIVCEPPDPTDYTTTVLAIVLAGAGVVLTMLYCACKFSGSSSGSGMGSYEGVKLKQQFGP